MKDATISELKAHLSEYLAQVRRGATLIVRDRRTPIARLSPLDPSQDDLQIDEPSNELPRLPKKGWLKLAKPVDVVALLREDRDQR